MDPNMIPWCFQRPRPQGGHHVDPEPPVHDQEARAHMALSQTDLSGKVRSWMQKYNPQMYKHKYTNVKHTYRNTNSKTQIPETDGFSDRLLWKSEIMNEFSPPGHWPQKLDKGSICLMFYPQVWHRICRPGEELLGGGNNDLILFIKLPYVAVFQIDVFRSWGFSNPPLS